MKSDLVILDRDGVINYDSDDYIKSVAEWSPIPSRHIIEILLKSALPVYEIPILHLRRIH